MAPSQPAVSFDAIIKADRRKKKNQELANKILLGKGRRTSAPGVVNGSKGHATASGSLASRVGVTKRSASVANLRSSTQKFQPSRAAAAGTSRQAPTNKSRAVENRLIAALDPGSGQATVRGKDVGFSIKGTSAVGPFIVVGSNFAPGTTAADIQSALEPVAGRMMSCWVTSSHPTVTAEMEFAEKAAADIVIANFHNQKADGRILSMRLKSVAATTTSKRNVDILNAPSGPAASVSHSPFDGFREQADRDRRQNRRADPEIEDGSYGFSDRDNSRRARGGDDRIRSNRPSNRSANGQGGNRVVEETGLYSDQMMVDTPPQNARNRGRRFR